MNVNRAALFFDNLKSIHFVSSKVCIFWKLI